MLLAVLPAAAQTVRIATWHVEMERRGPGLLLRDILKGEDPQVDAVTRIIAETAPDILLLTGIDWDLGLAAATALADVLAAAGAAYPHVFAFPPNSGMATGLDMDGDTRLGGPGDAQGFGWFAGQGAMVLLSRLPLETARARDFSGLLWSDFPGALLPEKDRAPFPSEAALAAQRLSSAGHWEVPVLLPGGGRLHLLCFYAGTPVFDGPEDRNGRRNHDEVMFWVRYLDGALENPPPDAPVVILGDANLDPHDGGGRRGAIRALLAHPRLQDSAPHSAGAARATAEQGGVNLAHAGDPAFDTADWSDADGPGNLRVSYVLPDIALPVVGSGVAWPPPGAPLSEFMTGPDLPRHRLVWVDVTVPP